MVKPTCQVADHDDALIDCICIRRYCPYDRLMCVECIRTVHKECNSRFYSRKELISQLIEQRKRIQKNHPKDIIELQDQINKLIKQLQFLGQTVHDLLIKSNEYKNDCLARLDLILENQKQLSIDHWKEAYTLLFNSEFQYDSGQTIPQIDQINNQITNMHPIRVINKSKSDWNTITTDKHRQITTLHSVFSLDISPDEKFIATAGRNDCSIQIWDPNTGQQVGDQLKGHTNTILSIKYSKTGDCIISSSGDRTIRLWDVETHKQIGEPIIGHTDRINNVQYTLDQRSVISCSNDMTIRIWDLITYQENIEKRIQHTSIIYSMATSPTMYQVAFSDVKYMIHIWDYDKHKQIRKISGHTNIIQSISYSDDGKLIVSCGRDLTIRIWDPIRRNQIGQTMIGYTGDVIYAAKFSADSRFIISGGDDKTVRIWDRFSGQQIGESLLHHKMSVAQTRFSLDGRYIISAGEDKLVIIMENPYI